MSMLPEDIVKRIPADPLERERWMDENFRETVVSPKFILKNVAKHQKLRRFVDLPKLFDLLKNKRLTVWWPGLCTK